MRPGAVTPRPIRIGAHVHSHFGDYQQQRAAWARAEELGVDAVFTLDHFFPPAAPSRGKQLECWTLLAAMAEVTQTVELGPLVTCNSYRNPNLLADMARTVDNISGGRLILGIGAGWFRRDYVEYGYEFGTVGDRLRALEASLEIIQDRWGKLDPPPVRKIPLLIGGTGEKVALRLVAEHADIWHCLETDPETVRRKSAVLDEWCARVGREPGEIERSCGGVDVVDHLDDLARSGMTLFTVGIDGPDYDMGALREALAWRDALTSAV